MYTILVRILSNCRQWPPILTPPLLSMTFGPKNLPSMVGSDSAKQCLASGHRWRESVELVVLDRGLVPNGWWTPSYLPGTGSSFCIPGKLPYTCKYVVGGWALDKQDKTEKDNLFVQALNNDYEFGEWSPLARKCWTSCTGQRSCSQRLMNTQLPSRNW